MATVGAIGIDPATGYMLLDGLRDPPQDLRAAVHRDWLESSSFELALTQLGSYARGNLIYGGSADWEALTIDTKGYILGSDGTDVLWSSVHVDEHAPTGFPNRTDTSISFADGSRTLTLAKTGVSFDVYVKGVKYTYTENQTKQITDTEGTWWFFIDATGTLDAAQIAPNLRDTAWVAIVYWNATGNVALDIAEERHGMTMDGSTHSLLHYTVGTRFESGLAAGDYTIAGDGSAEADAQLSIGDGLIADEDLAVTITDDSPQNLAPIAYIPVYYLDGAAPVWRKTVADVFPLYDNATNEISYNLDTAGTWSQPAATNNYYVAMWIFASTNTVEPVIAILGQRQDSKLNDAQDNNTYEALTFDTLPFQEMKVIYRLIFQTRYPQYANTPHAKLVDIVDLRTVSNLPSGTYVATAHSSLTGRDARNSHPASAIRLDLSNFGFLLSGLVLDTTDDVQAAMDVLDDILENTQTVNALWNFAAKLGIGTATVPHGGVGAASLAIEGADSSADGPHIQTTTASDDYPLLHFYSYAHDNIGIGIDAYNQGGWKSSNATANFMIWKTSGQLSFYAAESVAPGNAMMWAEAFRITKEGATLVPVTSYVYFRDAEIHLASLDDGHLDITADVSVDMNANVRVEGTYKIEFLDTGIYIQSSADTIGRMVADGYWQIGTGTPTHIAGVANSFHVTGRTEFDNTVWFDGSLASSNANASDWLWFEGASGAVAFAAYYTTDQFVWALGGRVGTQLVMCHYDWRGRDFDHAVQTNPTLYVHSATDPDSAADEWWSITHDVTDAVYAVGSGVHKFTGDMLSHGSAKHYFDAGAAIGTEYITSGADGYLDFYAATQFRFYEDALFDTDKELYFRDANVKLYSRFTGVLNIDTAGTFPYVEVQAQFLVVGKSGYNFPTIGLGSTSGTAQIDAGYMLNLTNNEVVWYLNADAGRNIIIGTQRTSYSQGVQTDPTLFVFSATAQASETDEWMSFHHDKTDAVYNLGSGVHKFIGGAINIFDNSDAASVQLQILEGDRATFANDDEIYQSFKLSNNAGTQTEFARMVAIATDVADGAEDGAVGFEVMVNGALTEVFRADATFATNWTDLTDTGETALHTHAAGAPAAHAIGSAGGFHTGAGLTAGHVLRASAADAFAFAAIAAGDLPTAIDAAKIGDGSVSNAEFELLDDYNTIGLSALTAVEVDQLENIAATTISEAQWGYLGGLDQALAQASSPTFAALDITGNITVGGTVDGVDVANLNTFGQQVVYKADNQEIDTSIVFANDDDLMFFVEQNEVWQFEFVIHYYGPVTPDIKFQLACDVAVDWVQGHFVAIAGTAAGSATSGNTAWSGAVNDLNQSMVVAAAGNVYGIARFTGVVAMPDTPPAGFFRLMWAQNTSNAVATVVYKGSYVKFKRLA